MDPPLACQLKVFEIKTSNQAAYSERHIYLDLVILVFSVILILNSFNGLSYK